MNVGKKRTTTELREVCQSKTVRVDREAGIIHGVRVLGLTSLNHRRYLPEAARNAKPLYEGSRVNADHPENPNGNRSIDDRIGWLKSITEDADGGLSADLHLLKSDPRSSKIMEAAERNPELFGLSHNAEGRTRREGDTVIVEEILRVRSVDVVSDPATTRSLFESMDDREKVAMKKTVRQILEAAPDRIESKLVLGLREEDPAGMMATAPVDVPADASSDDQIKAAFRSAIVAAFDDDKLDMQSTLGKMKEILKAYDKLTGDGGGDSKPAGDSAPAGDAATPESVQRVQRDLRKLRAEVESHKLLEAAGVAAEDVRVKALVALESVEDRKALIATWKHTGNQHELPRSQPLRESNGNGGRVDFPKNPEEFARAIRR